MPRSVDFTATSNLHTDLATELLNAWNEGCSLANADFQGEINYNKFESMLIPFVWTFTGGDASSAGGIGVSSARGGESWALRGSESEDSDDIYHVIGELDFPRFPVGKKIRWTIESGEVRPGWYATADVPAKVTKDIADVRLFVVRRNVDSASSDYSIEDLIPVSEPAEIRGEAISEAAMNGGGITATELNDSTIAYFTRRELISGLEFGSEHTLVVIVKMKERGEPTISAFPDGVLGAFSGSITLSIEVSEV